MAPEVILKKKFSHKSDLFSFGGILYYMVTGKQVFASKHKDRIFEKTLECDL
jgi:serine/threonine protein kinase